MVSLSGYLRSLAEKGVYNQDEITMKYEAWLLDHRYMVMCKEKEAWLSDAGTYEYKAYKCAKRGNDVYSARVDARLRGIGANCSDLNIDLERNPYTNMLFITLTYDTKLCDFDVAWKNIGVEFNRFRANLRKKWGEFSVFRCFESFKNGHPHVHLVAIFKEKTFKAFKNKELNRKGEVKEVWRIEEKHDFEPYWHSQIDVKAVYNLKGGLNYLKKYIMKCSSYDQSDRSTSLTLAMCWVFRKKAFYVSGQFRRALSDLIRVLSSSKTTLIQIDLTSAELKPNRWVVLGFISASFLDWSPEKWYYEISADDMSEIFEYWDKWKQGE